MNARRVHALWQSTNGPERLALVPIVLTPVALFLDYRVHLAPYDRLVTFLPILEAGGAPQHYHQLIGLTQILWLGCGLAALAGPSTRAGFQSLTVAALFSTVVVLLGSTAAQGGIDKTTGVLLTSSLLPMIAMAAILLNPHISPRWRRDLVLIAIAWTAAIVVLTIAKKAHAGTLHDRFTTFVFGAPTDTSLDLAAMLVLLPIVRPRLLAKLSLAGVLGVGLLLTQTRGGLVSAAAGGLVLALFLPRLRVWILGGVVLVVVSFALASDRSLKFNDTSTNFRRANLAQHWHVFTSKPLFGWGLDESSLQKISGGNNALLGVADAGGAVAAVLFFLAWATPVALGIFRCARSPTTATMVGTSVAVFVGWNTTGAEILTYTPPSNFLPLVLACSLGASTQLSLAQRDSRLVRNVQTPTSSP